MVDDVEDLVESLALLLEADGYAVVRAGDGDAALQAVRERHPDLVLLDHLMPARTGADLGRELKAEPGLSGQKIVMHSATPEEQVRRTFDDYDEFLRKPCPPGDLLEIVANLLGVERRAKRRPSPERKPR